MSKSPVRINLGENASFLLFQTEDAAILEFIAGKLNQAIYTYRTTGVFNWLEKGLHFSDALGITLVDNNLPEIIELPDDLLDDD